MFPKATKASAAPATSQRPDGEQTVARGRGHFQSSRGRRTHRETAYSDSPVQQNRVGGLHVLPAALDASLADRGENGRERVHDATASRAPGPASGTVTSRMRAASAMR